MKFKKCCNVKYARVKDSYIFNKKSKGTHLYLVNDSNPNKVKLQELTHMYIPDKKRFSQKAKGLIEEIYLDDFGASSGLKKRIITKDINGKKISSSDLKKYSNYIKMCKKHYN